MFRTLRSLCTLLVLTALALTFQFLLAPGASAQGPVTGTPPFGSFGGGPDVINLANLNSHITIPVLHKPGRGTDFTYDLSYDSSVWYPVTSGSTTTWKPAYNWGFRGQTEIATGYIFYGLIGPGQCSDKNGNRTTGHYEYLNWTYHDPFGVQHAFSGNIQVLTGSCYPHTNGSLNVVATDGSGLTLNASVNGSTGAVLASIIRTNGELISPPLGSGGGSAASVDRNGNQITANGSGNFYDTLSSTSPVLTVTGSGTPTSPTVFAYTAPSGSPASYTMSYVAYTVATNFAVSGIGEYGAHAVNLVDKITLPDNTFYEFNYEQTPSTPSPGACTPLPGTYQTNCVTARLWKVTLPTGGQIIYTYSGGAGTNSSGIWSDGSAATLTRATPDGTWTYAQAKGTGAASITTVTDPTTPTANQTKIQFQGIYETQRDVYQGSTSSGTLLSTVNTCYNSATSPCNSTAITLPIGNRAVISTIPSAGSASLVGKTISTYTSIGVPTEVDTYAFGSGAPPSTPTTKTIITYASLGNITAFRQTVKVENGAGTILAQINYNYDETTPVAAPTGTPQLTSVSGSRGNLTSVQKCTVLTSCSSYLSTTMTYDTAGQVQKVTDARGNFTTFGYADSYYTDNGSNPAQPYTSSVPTDAFATTITPPLIGAATAGYYFYSGQLAVATDQNGNNSYRHFQDSLSRPTTTYGPLLPIPGTSTLYRPWSLAVYASTDTQVDSYVGIGDTTASASCSSCRHDQALLDGLGRVTTQELVSDPEGATTSATTYDSRGSVNTASHPYRSTSDPTYGLETPTYDAIGRTIKVTHPDTTFSQAAYGPNVTGTGVNTTQLCSSSTYGLGFPVLSTDESGRRREVWADGLGRTIEADEPDSSGNLTSNTCYSYDPLGNLLQIVHGSQTRTYVYDALSRATSVTIPELANSTGTNCAVTYGYDSNSNVITRTSPAPNQTTCTTTVTITYSYDALNRLTGKTYSDSSPAIKYGYDAVALTGCATTPPALTDSNPKGRMTAMCDSSGATSWAHDALGKILAEKRTILGATETTSYVYNLDGSPETVTYPSGKTVTYTVSNAQRLTSAKDTTSGTQFALVASYAAPGGLQGMITGQISGGFGGVTESHTFNSSLEYTSTKATSTVGTALDLSLAYSLTGGDNGTLTKITNNADNGRTQTLGYDPLNRISSASTQATSGVDCWGESFGPDSLANLNSIGVTQCSPPGTLSVTVDANNHINSGSSYAYDALGNMTKDGTGNTYTFDDEGRFILASGPSGGPYCYVYDGNGLRVGKKSGASSCSSGTVTKLYWRSISGDSLAETDSSGSTTNSAYNEYVFFAGRRIASRNGTGTIFYYFADQLGTTRTITTGNGPGQTPGQLCYDADFTPFGQEIQYTARLQTTACPPNYRFTGYEYDAETGLNYAFARYYSPRLGRFLSTDPLRGSIGSLQSHNAYAYTLNNPANGTDPSGMNCKKAPPGGCNPTVITGVGGGSGGDCIIDGIESPCGLATGESNVQCPNNLCTGIGSDGRPIYFFASANGPGGYYNYSGPGALYYSQDAAGAAATLYYGAYSTQSDADGKRHEYLGNGYVDQNGVFSYVLADIGPACAESAGTCTGIGSWAVPEGTQIVFDWHTHPWANGSFGGPITQTTSAGGLTWVQITWWGDRAGPNPYPTYVSQPVGTGYGVFLVGAGTNVNVCQLSGPSLAGTSGCP